MFTLQQSIINISRYILDNWRYLLDDNWSSKHGWESADGYEYTVLCYHNEEIVQIHYDHIKFENTYNTNSVIHLIKTFNIPDFHAHHILNIDYESVSELDKLIVNDPTGIQHDIYMNLSTYDDDDYGSGDIYYDKECLEDIITRSNIKGVILSNEDINAETTMKYLFKHMPNLKYIWVDNIEYTRINNIITSCEFDYELRIISLHYHNELLEDDYKDRYCVYNKLIKKSLQI